MKNKRLESAIDKLASLFDDGILLACTDPASLLNMASAELECSRKNKGCPLLYADYKKSCPALKDRQAEPDTVIA